MREWDRLPLVERNLRLEQFNQGQLRCDCGNPVHVCSDPAFVGYPYRRVCNAAMERAGAEGLYAALHDEAPYHDGTFQNWNAKRTRQFPFHYGDGVQIGVAGRDLTPWDPFTTDANASPWPPVAEEQEGT